MLGIKIANGVKTTSGKEVDEHEGRTDNAYRQKDVFYLSFCPVIFHYIHYASVPRQIVPLASNA